MKKTCYIAILFLVHLSTTVVYSQVTTGTWKGIAKQDATNYSYTVKINKVVRDSIFGTTISSSNNFYSETKFKGNVNGNNLTIQESELIKTNYKGTGSVCLMKLILKKNNEKLQGSFTSSNKDIKDCGSGTVSLQLVKEKKDIINSTKESTSIQRQEVESRPATILVSKPEELPKARTIEQTTKIKIHRKIEKRDIDLLNTFKFTEDSVMIKVFDNGVIDGDVISLIVNGATVFDKIKLTAIPLTYALKATTTKQFQVEFYAESLGEIPPNTGLITISSATKTNEVLFSSDLKKSAAIQVILKNIP